MRSTFRLAVLGSLTLVLAACAGSTASVGTTSEGGAQVAPVPAVAPEVGKGAVTADGSMTRTDGYAVGAQIDTKVIKTGSMSMEVEDIDRSVADARTAIVALGGYISGTTAYDQGTQRFASITYRIPADRWDEALAALRRIGTKVTDEQTGAVEVTAQIVDLDARVRNLKATETQLLEIMTKATRIADILAVQTQLTQVRGDIESLSGQLKQLNDQADLGTLTVTFTIPVAAISQAQEGWDLGKQVDGALAALIGLGQFVVSAAIWLVLVGLPALLGVAVVWFLVRLVAGRLGVALPRRRRDDPAA